jgi:hypothetical protein
MHVRPTFPDYQVLKALRVFRVMMVRLVLRVLKALRVFRVMMERLVLRDLRDRLG